MHYNYKCFSVMRSMFLNIYFAVKFMYGQFLTFCHFFIVLPANSPSKTYCIQNPDHLSNGWSGLILNQKYSQNINPDCTLTNYIVYKFYSSSTCASFAAWSAATQLSIISSKSPFITFSSL